jgi:RHS repeat-associated protein
MSLLLLVCIAAGVSNAQQHPIIDPDPGGSGYGAAVGARPLAANDRSSSKPNGIYWIGGPLKVPILVGSKSYEYVIPIVHLAGRNGMDLNINCYYNSAVWGLNPSGRSLMFNIDRDFPAYGFRCDFGYAEYDSLNDQIILTENDGSKHALPNNGVGSYDSSDGSYINYSRTTNIATFRNGTRIQYSGFPSQGASPSLFRPVWEMNRNGNYFSIAYVSGGADQQLSAVSDSLGRVITYNYDGQGRLISLTQAVHTYTDPSGTKTYASFTWGAVALNYNFSLAVKNSPVNGTAINVITKCTYPNGTAYAFTYGDWGIVTRIDHLSSAGDTQNYVSFNYPTAASALADVPTFTQKTVSPDGTHAFIWTNVFTTPTLGNVTSLTVTDPNGNKTVTNTDGSGFVTSVQKQNSAGTTLATNSYTYTISGPGTVVASITRTFNDTGQVSSVQYTYDSNGNATHVNEYDWGNQLKRQTATTYATGAYLTKHILDLPTQVLVEDTAGTVTSRTDIAYDSTSLTSLTGAANHDDTDYPASFLTRGNLSSVTRYSNAAAGTGGVTRTLNYDTLGNVLTAQADCCVQEAFSFSSTTQYAYPDSIVTGPGTGPQFTETFTYNLDNGLVFSDTDPNGQITSFQYDSMSRPTVTTPPSPGTVTTLVYGDNVVSPTITESNTANSLQIVHIMDGVGELLEADNKNGSTLVGKTTYAYDGAGQQTQVSNPFGPNETAVNTTLSYDPLGRVTQITPPSGGSTQSVYSGNSVTITDPAGKQSKTFTDALGRLVEVDEPGWGDAVPATGTVNITAETGGTGDQWSCTTIFNGRCLGKFWDTGTVTLTVHGVPKTVTYGSLDTTTSIATNLAAAFHNDTGAPVDATSLGTVITLTARAAGTVGNSYAMSGSTTTNDPNDFYPGSFFANPATSTLNKGLDAAAQSSPTLVRPLVTTYVYDVLNNLISSSEAAMQLWNGSPVAGQLRTYVYDGLGRRTSFTTPEQGTITNFYTNASGQSCANDPAKICRIQDARGLVKTFTYDGINRVATVGYSDSTPGQTYTYDSGGAPAFALHRLTEVTEGATNSQTFVYDALGRVTSVSHVIDQSTYPVLYGYNPLNQLASITYPSGRVITQGYDAIGRPSTTSSGSTTYLTVSAYNAGNQPLNTQLGNGVLGTFGYNDHLQLSTLRYNLPSGSNDVLNLGYDYGTTNNGQIKAVHYYTVPGTEDLTKTENFTYDPWKRLQAAQTTTVSGTAGTWSLQWTYDRLGNRLTQSLVGGNVSIGQPQLVVDTNTNRITGFGFDASGNMTSDGVNTYTYDAANRLTQVNTGAGTYTYFGALRIKKVVGSTTTIYIYSADRPIAEYANGSLSKEYVYAGSRLLATIASGTATYHHPDHLSNRAETDTSGNVIRSFGHFPFGEVWYESPSTDKWKFTTYERDSESGLDYAVARFDSTGLGRFTSPDPLPGYLSNPESLNRYSYVTNDPINFLDPTGMSGVPGITHVCLLDEHGDNTSKCASISPDSEGNVTHNGGDPFGWAMSALNEAINNGDLSDDITKGESNDPFADRNALDFGSDPLSTAEKQYNALLPTIEYETKYYNHDGTWKFSVIEKPVKLSKITQTPGSASMIPPVVNRSLGSPKIPQRPPKFRTTGSSPVVPLLTTENACSGLYAWQILLGSGSDGGLLAFCGGE